MPLAALILENDRQQLSLAPQYGGAIAGWSWKDSQGPLAVMSPAKETAQDAFDLAGFALLPWANRITQGGFAHQGSHYAVAENREGEPYPLHGDGWRQVWNVQSQSDSEAVLSLHSRQHHGNPHEYEATQRFELTEAGLRITLKITHRGRAALLYGLGYSLCLPFEEDSRLQAAASGVWLSGPDPIPIAHTGSFPPGWDFRHPSPPAAGQPVDNCFTGWDGDMRLSHPSRALVLALQMKDSSGYYVLQRREGAQYIRFEPVTHPIDAFHAKARPGLVSLAAGESLQLQLELRVERMDAAP